MTFSKRSNLHGNVKGLPDYAAKPNSAENATARKSIPAQLGTFYPLGVFNARLDEVAYTTEPLTKKAPDAGKRYLTATFTLKNAGHAEAAYYWGCFTAELRDAEGEKSPYTQTLLKATRDEAAQGKLMPGEEARVRLYFSLSKDVTGKTLQFAEGIKVHPSTARVFAFDVSGGAK